MWGKDKQAEWRTRNERKQYNVDKSMDLEDMWD
jgi:hypothetical protein